MAKQESHKLQSQVRFLAAQPNKNMITPIKSVVNSTERNAQTYYEVIPFTVDENTIDAQDELSSNFKNVIYNEKGAVIDLHHNSVLNEQA